MGFNHLAFLSLYPHLAFLSPRIQMILLKCLLHIENYKSVAFSDITRHFAEQYISQLQ